MVNSNRNLLSEATDSSLKNRGCYTIGCSRSERISQWPWEGTVLFCLTVCAHLGGNGPWSASRTCCSTLNSKKWGQKMGARPVPRSGTSPGAQLVLNVCVSGTRDSTYSGAMIQPEPSVNIREAGTRKSIKKASQGQDGQAAGLGVCSS